MPGGRPPKVTPALVSQISEAFVFGFTDEEAATLVQIDEKTIRRMREGRYCPQIKRAELGRKATYIRRITEGKRPDWARWAWFLERRFPLQFAKPEIQLNVDNRSVHQTLVINAEVAGAIGERMKSVHSEIADLIKGRRGPTNGNGAPPPGDKKSGPKTTPD